MIAKGIATLRRALPAILEDQTNTLSGLLRELLLELRDRLRLLDERLHNYICASRTWRAVALRPDAS